jgi:hypothetical protein
MDQLKILECSRCVEKCLNTREDWKYMTNADCLIVSRLGALLPLKVLGPSESGHMVSSVCDHFCITRGIRRLAGVDLGDFSIPRIVLDPVSTIRKIR